MDVQAIISSDSKFREIERAWVAYELPANEAILRLVEIGWTTPQASAWLAMRRQREILGYTSGHHVRTYPH